ncbi:hypothetical protein GCM10022198_10740 [Klugiella xanthotipulae]
MLTGTTEHPVTIQRVPARTSAVEGPPVTIPAQELGRLEILAGQGRVRSIIRCHGQEVMALAGPHAIPTLDASPRRDERTPVCLDPGTYIHWESGIAVIANLATSTRITVPGEVVAQLLGPHLPAWQAQLLLHAGVLQKGPTPAGEPGRWWSFEELLSYNRSRLGTHLGEYGGSYTRATAHGSIPEWTDGSEGAPACEPEPVVAAGRTLGECLTNRHSRRDHSAPPASLSEVAALLTRSAHATPCDPDPGQGTALYSLPYPAGGALDELSHYIVVNRGVHRGADLSHSVFRYDHLSDAITPVAVNAAACDRLCALYARMGMIPPDELQYLILVACDFPRLSHKYESVAAALMYKHVGAWMQTASLVAEDLNLAVCPLGGGPADILDSLFTEATTTTSGPKVVGEFVVASRPAAESAGYAAAKSDRRTP